MTQYFAKFLIALAIFSMVEQQSIRSVEALWWFSDLTSNHSVAQLIEIPQTTPQPVVEQASKAVSTETPFSIAGIRPSSIATLLNTVSETGFHYFNVHDQCRSRTACDVGFMLYRKLNFVHNWLIRTSVRTLVDNNNVYAQAWSNGMIGKNCTTIYPSCNQSPIESIMNFALLAA